jgi:uncharacterized protein YfaS (alpha-2-macroglobulin family)
VINSRFKTESSAIREAGDMAYNFNYVEYRPDRVMANASYVWSGNKEIAFEYYFRAEFEGSYVQPPIVGYLMYEPEVRSSGEFREVEVK